MSEPAAKRLRIDWKVLYRFSVDTHDEVVGLDRLQGCTTILHVLEAEIGAYLSTPTAFELSAEGHLPLSRFIRFYGVVHSSKATAVLAFAKHKKIDLIHIQRAASSSTELYELHKKLHSRTTPCIVLMSDVDTMLATQPGSLSVMHNCLRAIEETRLPVWTVALTTTRNQLPYVIDVLFAECTIWAGITMPTFELFTPLNRANMFRQCFSRYAPDPADFPWRKLHEFNDFIERTTGYCTYRQIRQYIRRVFLAKRRSDPGFKVPTKDDFERALCPIGPNQALCTIAPIPPKFDNVDIFLN